MIENWLIEELERRDVIITLLCKIMQVVIQQKKQELLKDYFNVLVSGDVPYPARCCDVNPVDFTVWGEN